MNKKLKINVDWVKNIKDKADQQSFVDLLTSSPVTHRLKEILEARKKERETFKEVDYESHSWAYLAADRNGYNRAINDILRLLDVKEKD